MEWAISEQKWGIIEVFYKVCMPGCAIALSD
jgi:hypothetical protein